MSNINLNLVTEDASQKKASIFGKKVTIPLLALVLVLLLYGALLYMDRNLSSKINNTKAEFTSEFDKFLAGNGNEVMDFGNRSAVARELIAEDQSIANIFKKIEESTLPSVFLDSFNYDKDKKTISLLYVGGNLNTTAKQILSFKQNEYFSEVTSKESSVDPERGGMIFKIDLKIK